MAQSRIPWTVSFWAEDEVGEAIDRLCKAAGRSRRDALIYLWEVGRGKITDSWAKEIAKGLAALQKGG